MMKNIPEKILVGLTKETVKDLVVANILAKNNNRSFKAKEEKFRADHQEVREIDNELFPGFYIVKPDRANWSKDKPWYVADPRGFAFRLTQNNIENIISTSLISNGIIQESCQWCRSDDDTTNIYLISESSSEYNSVVESTTMIKNRISMDQVEIGDTVELQNGLAGVYMGVHSLYHPMEVGFINYRLTQKVTLRQQIIKVGVGQYYYHADAKILRVAVKSSRRITEPEAADMINQEISAISTYFSRVGDVFTRATTPKYYHSTGVVRFVYPRSTSKFSLELREIDEEEAIKLFYTSNNIGDCTSVVLEQESGVKYLINAPRNISSNSMNPPNHHLLPLMSVAVINKDHIDLVNARPYILTRGRSKTAGGIDIEDFKKFYKLVKVVKDREFV